jgi:hypothetical protein
MSPENIQKLLGGYATGTLTPEEQQALFEAALSDQDLFDALAREQPLHDLLRDPASRAHLLAALDDRPAPWYARWGWRPMAATLAMASLVTLAVVALRRAQAPRPVTMAELKSVPLPRPQALPFQPAPPAAKPAAEARQPARQTPHARRLDAPLRPAAPVAPEVAAPAAAPPTDAIASLRDTEAKTKAEVQVQAAAPNAALATIPSTNARALFYATPAQLQEFSGASRGGQGGGGGPRFQQQQQQQLAQNRAAAPMAKAIAAAQVANPGVRYRILRQNPSGEFAEADPDSLRTGDTVEIEFTPNDAGFLLVSSGARPILSSSVERLKPYTTGPLPPADRQLTVLFTQPADPADKKDAPVVNLVQAQSAETFVVSSRPAQPVRFTITLNYK